jgi:hypothetical protein
MRNKIWIRHAAPKVGEPVALFSYLNCLVTPKWADTLKDLWATQFGMRHCEKVLLEFPRASLSNRSGFESYSRERQCSR